MATALSDLMAKWQESQEGARLSNIKRSEQITAIYDEIIRRYEPGGTFGKAALGQLEKQKVRDVGGEMQQMISSGLYGTTTAAGTGRRWEESVGAPSRLRLEDIMMQRLSEAQVGKAGFMERIEEPYPDYAMMASLMQQGAAGPRYTPQPQPVAAGGRTTFGASSFPDQFSIGGGTARAAGGTGGAVYGAGTKEATMAERERRAQAAASVSPGVMPTAGTGTPTPTTQQPVGVPTSLAVGAQMSRMIGQPEAKPDYTAYGDWLTKRHKEHKTGGTYQQFLAAEGS